MKVHPIPHSIDFWNQKTRIYSNFASLFSVVKDKSSLFFQLKPHILWSKITHRSEVFGLLGENLPNSSCQIWKWNDKSVFFKTLHHSSMSWEITLLQLFSWNFIWFLQREPIKVQNFRLLTVQVKFLQIGTVIVSFC